MTSLNVRIDHRHKEHLERLREKWREQTGHAPSPQEVVDRLLEHAAAHPDAIIDELTWHPFSPEEIQAIEDEAIDVGKPLDLSTNIDETVYDRDWEMGRK